MAERVKNLGFKSRINTDGGAAKGKLFLGVLGVEYSIPYSNGGFQSFDVLALGSATRPTADKLLYGYINRTNALDEWAYADGVLPVYLRYQPDLVYPLTLASQDSPDAGPSYVRQWISLEEPEVRIEGNEATVDDTGATTYNEVPVDFVIPVNPSALRRVRLSVEDGLFVWLARIR